MSQEEKALAASADAAEEVLETEEAVAGRKRQGLCIFYIRRKKRFCTKMSNHFQDKDNEHVCDLHSADNLRKLREASLLTRGSGEQKSVEEKQRLKREKRRARLRVSSSQNRMTNPLGKLYQVVPEISWDQVYAD